MLNNVKVVRRLVRSIFLFSLISVGVPGGALAQTIGPWQWRLDSTVFAGVNHQNRAFKDFTHFESQNWFMGTGERTAGPGEVRLFSMISLEPFTMEKIGSAQVFQTGETFDNQPLVDYQHPHDLLTALGVSFSVPVADWTMTTTAAAVGSPTLGPTPFMHRPSAAENLQAPLSHHYLDSTHITPGVLSVEMARGSANLGASLFRGREPDERRTDIDFGALDSWAVRGMWKESGWEAQVSGGRLKNPDFTHPGDVVRLTASIGHSYSGAISTQVFGAWGQNREAIGPLNAYLFESQISWLGTNHFFSRAELVTKDIIHIIDDGHGHVIDGNPLSEIGAFTLGYVRDLNNSMRARFGIGSDITMYYVPQNLKESYGGPVSFHFFVRYRFTTAAMLDNMNHHH